MVSNNKPEIQRMVVTHLSQNLRNGSDGARTLTKVCLSTEWESYSQLQNSLNSGHTWTVDAQGVSGESLG